LTLIHQNQTCVSCYIGIIAKGIIKPSPFKLVSAYGMNCWMFFWKPIKVDVGDNQNLPWMQLKMKSWICFGQGKSKNSNFVMCAITSSHLPSIVNNIGSSLVVIKPWR